MIIKLNKDRRYVRINFKRQKIITLLFPFESKKALISVSAVPSDKENSLT